MAIVKEILVSNGEKVSYNILKKYENEISIFPKVRFFDVFEWNTASISTKEHNYLEKTHFDFIICQKDKGYKPIFAIEFDGIGKDYKNIDKYRELKKNTKLRICKEYEFPIIWIDSKEITEVDGETILDAIIRSYIEGRFHEENFSSYDEYETGGFMYFFKPMNRLRRKYSKIIIGIESRGIKQSNEQIETKEILKVATVNGIHEIIKTAKIQYFKVPYFHPFELLEDLAIYKCLRELDKLVKKGFI